MMRKFAAARVQALGAVLLAVASLAFCAINGSGHVALSPADEYVYIDYYVKVLDQGVVREGEDVGDFTRQYLSCHSNRAYGPFQPKRCPIEVARPDAYYPFDGMTSADIYTPLYFFTVRAAAQPLVWAGFEVVTAGRMAGGVWLAFAVVLLYLTLLRLKVHWTIASGVSLIMAGSLPAYWANTYLSTDGTALAAGAWLLYLAVGLIERPTNWRVASFVLVGGLMTAFKVQNLTAVVVAGFFLMLLALRDAREEGGSLVTVTRRCLLDKRTLATGGAVVLGMVAQVVWLLIRSKLAVGSIASMGIEEPFDFPLDLVRDMLAFLPEVAQGAAPAVLLGDWGLVSFALLKLVVVVGALGLLCTRGAGYRDRSLAVAVVFASLVAGPALSLATVLVNGLYVPLVPRYGTSVVPGMLVCLALLLPSDSKTTRALALGFGALMFALTFAWTQQ